MNGELVSETHTDHDRNHRICKYALVSQSRWKTRNRVGDEHGGRTRSIYGDGQAMRQKGKGDREIFKRRASSIFGEGGGGGKVRT